MAESFHEVFNEINLLIEEGEIDIDGERIPLEFYLGGDYKVEKIYTKNWNIWHVVPSA